MSRFSDVRDWRQKLEDSIKTCTNCDERFIFPTPAEPVQIIYCPNCANLELEVKK